MCKEDENGESQVRKEEEEEEEGVWELESVCFGCEACQGNRGLGL